jgi:hypothetical protein
MTAQTGLPPPPPPPPKKKHTQTHTRNEKRYHSLRFHKSFPDVYILYIRCPPSHMFNLLGLQFRNSLQEW